VEAATLGFGVRVTARVRRHRSGGMDQGRSHDPNMIQGPTLFLTIHKAGIESTPRQPF